MIKKIFITILLVITFTSSAKCEEDITTDIRSKGFLNICQNPIDNYSNGECFGFFLAIVEFREREAIITNDNSLVIDRNITYNGHKENFIKFLKNSPKRLHEYTIDLFLEYK